LCFRAILSICVYVPCCPPARILLYFTLHRICCTNISFVQILITATVKASCLWWNRTKFGISRPRQRLIVLL